MKNNDIYDYTFSVMRKNVQKHKDEFEEHFKYNLYKPIIVLKDDTSRLYNSIANSLNNVLVVELEYMIMRLFKNNNVEFFACDNKQICKRIPFYRIEDEKKVVYAFSFNEMNNSYESVLKETGADKMKQVLVGEKIGDTIDMIWDWEQTKSKDCIEFITIKEVFDLINEEEYKVFKTYVEAFNKDVRHMVGYNTIAIPSDAAISDFKKTVIEKLNAFDYKSMLIGLPESQIDIMNNNFFNRELINSLVSDNAFSDSFISAEWYYSTQVITTSLENTAVVAGYFKSIEQLLYKLIRLFDNKGKTIKKKNSSNNYVELSVANEGVIDFSLGPMSSFLRYYGNRDIWMVNDDVIDFISDNLKDYRQRYRNDHFHKDNLYDINEIDEIRKHTILLYYLLLGGININDSSKQILMPETVQEHKENELDYDMVAKWLDGILGGDNLLNMDNSIFIQINSSTKKILFTTIKNVREDGLLDMEGYDAYHFISDECFFASDNSKEEVENDVIDYVRRYLKEGKYNKKLSDFNAVYVGLDITPKLI